MFWCVLAFLFIYFSTYFFLIFQMKDFFVKYKQIIFLHHLSVCLSEISYFFFFNLFSYTSIILNFTKDYCCCYCTLVFMLLATPSYCLLLSIIRIIFVIFFLIVVQSKSCVVFYYFQYCLCWIWSFFLSFVGLTKICLFSSLKIV